MLRIVVGTVMAILILTGVATVTFMHAFGPRDGESIAHAQVDAAARTIQHRVSRPGPGVDAATLAATQFGDVAGATVEPYAWRGSTSDPDGARLDVRIKVSVQPEPSTRLFQPGVAAGSAQGCFRFHVREGRSSYRPIDCPATMSHSTPTPSESPSP
ncbi:hypothetical protein ITJ43_01365 [Microbacterium sp. VKM Ac-2870]|nr:hypothetical protein [Microbacterium sp. VKM Ac-2870]